PAAEAFSNHKSVRPLELRSSCNTGRGPLQIEGGVALNAATCITHPLAPHGAVALYVPAASATMSSTISLFGFVNICITYPGPGPAKEPVVVPAANSNSLVWPVVSGPLSASRPEPLPEDPTSKGSPTISPAYSVARRSTKCAGWSNMTVTVLL